ncbi:MAG TPA: cytidine deaminase [Nocardioidaceae bacterium]|nr:cytidine deaminase [Nocardioidaceae bacterium]
MVELDDPEDRKLVTLARAHRARAGAAEGAAVRDRDGRAYSAADVDLPSLQLSALQLAVASAVASGVTGLEAAVVVTESLAGSDADLDAVRDLAGHGVPVYRVAVDGVVVERVTT